MPGSNVNHLTNRQRLKLQFQTEKVQRLQSLLLDLEDGVNLHSDLLCEFDSFDSLFDEFTHSQSFLFGMLYMVRDDPDLNFSLSDVEPISFDLHPSED